jgi:hypothetical protein
MKALSRLALGAAPALVLALARDAHAHDSMQSALRAIDAQLTPQRTVEADVDGDGDLDALITVENAVGYSQCVVAVRDGSQWSAHALTGPGGDDMGRCVGAADGVVVYAVLHSSGREANEFARVTVGVAAVSSRGVPVISQLSLGRPPARTFEQLELSVRGGTVSVRAPRARTRSLRTR